MKDKIVKLKENISRLAESGFLHIIVSSTLAKAVSFVSAMFLPKIITDKVEYGLLSYVDNIRSYILLINGLGIMHAIMRFCTKESDEARKWGRFKSIVKTGLVFDVIIVSISIAAMLIIPERFDGERNYLLISSLIPIFFFLFESVQLYLRACFKNQQFSYLSFIYTFLMVVLQIGSAYFAGVTGVLYSR